MRHMFLTLYLDLLLAFWTQIRPDKTSRPDLYPNCLTLLKDLSEKLILTNKISRRQKSMQNFPVGDNIGLSGIFVDKNTKIIMEKQMATYMTILRVCS